jgi:TAG lipase / steryl ester hydrolase / phospholipase A2 / LPA acyltransferase
MISSRVKKIEAAMASAESYQEWRHAAIEHDEQTNAAQWRKVDRSPRYDYTSIRARLDHLRNLRARGDDRGLLFALNEGIHGNIDGIGSSALYGKAKFGTKVLVENYVEEVAEALEHLASPDVDSISFEEKLDFFQRASHCFGRSALMMSGSGTLLYFHLGVAKALWQEGLLPNIVSGSSGGALVGSVMCASSDEELDQLFNAEDLPGRENPAGLISRLVSVVKPQRVTVDDIWSMLEEFLPDYTFDDAYQHTGRHMNVSVAPAENHQKSRLLNADTSPNVFMREAVLASTAIPGFFPPVVLMARNDQGERQEYHGSRKWVDGSISEDLPAKRLARLYGVNHYIVSQTNPYIIPFIDTTKRRTDAVSEVKYALYDTARAWINASAAIFEKPLSLVPDVQKLTNSALSMINQSYVGDITISPITKLHNPLKSLAWRTHDEIRELMDEGKRATWPQIERIRIQTRISRTLDPILHSYEEQHIEEFGKPARKASGRARTTRRKAS